MQGRNHVFKVGVQFLGLGYYIEQNADGIPSFVHCSVLRNGNHTLHTKLGWSVQIFWGSGPPSRPPVVAPLPACKLYVMPPHLLSNSSLQSTESEILVHRVYMQSQEAHSSTAEGPRDV